MHKIPKYHYVEEVEMYVLEERFEYYSFRYDKDVLLLKGMISDGATCAIDIKSAGWWVHDRLCEDMTWRDGTPCSRWQSSRVLSDILKAEGRWARQWYWRFATYLPWKLGFK